MVIVPSTEPSRLLRRQEITVDLFTRHGSTWQEISRLRTEWNIEFTVQVPPEPPFHAELVGLLTRWQMPERFHVPPIPPQWGNGMRSPRAILEKTNPSQANEMMSYLADAHQKIAVGIFLKDIEALWEVLLPDDNKDETNVHGWMSWTPFLSACVLYDPPPLELLEFAVHDDHNAAQLPQLTVRQSARKAIDAERRRAHAMSKTRNTREQMIVHALYSKEMASTYKPSALPDPPRQQPGRPKKLSSLVLVQCAVMRRQGMSSADIAKELSRRFPNEISWSVRSDEYGTRHRSDSVERAIRDGEAFLRGRGA